MALQFDNQEFRKAILHKRVDVEIDRRSLANKVNVNHTTLWRIEKGFSPTLQHFADLCDWLGKEVPFHKKANEE